MLWACQNLSTLPDPTKPVWEQDPKILDILRLTEEAIRDEKINVEEELKNELR